MHERPLSDLHRRNLAALGPRDVLVASFPGAGQALVGNVLLQLGLNYVDAYTDELFADGSARPSLGVGGYRARLEASARRDREGPDRRGAWPRFVKSHLGPGPFAARPPGAIWLLVRDPRDALCSWYHWRVAFAEEPWDRVDGSFADFLAQPDHGDVRPVDDWAAFHTEWVDAVRAWPAAATTRFEDLKRDAVVEIAAALRALGVGHERDDLERAVAASSFEAMRAHEDDAARRAGAGSQGARIMRSGRVEGWREWMTPELSREFAHPPLRRAASLFGYRMP